MPKSVAFMQASSCWGCHQSLLNAHVGLLGVLPELDIVYWPAVVDYKRKDLEAHENGSIDVGFYEGQVRTQDDLDNLILMREKCKTLIAFGACATTGGIPGLGNLYSREEMMKRKFLDVESLEKESAQIPSEDVPEILEKIYPVDHYVDYTLSLHDALPI